ncbi:MAG: SGNH/GDSL hydrolase family protein [Solobacterium sp.]|nr:SGNH/GDSL hydrolase family protein [Solobacterium sp.]
MSIKILCYGDSNTFGYVPAGEGARYEYGERWCGILQKLLGKEYHVIEAGHNGRTTDLDVIRDPLRNGLKNIEPVISMYEPLDLVIVMLGTNDCKEEFHRNADAIANGLESIVKRIREHFESRQETSPEIIIVNPACVRAEAAYGPFGHEFSKRSHEVSLQMESAYRKLSRKLETKYLDASAYIEASALDGIHLGKEAHRALAEKLYELITQQ